MTPIPHPSDFEKHADFQKVYLHWALCNYARIESALTPESEGIAGKVQPVVWWHILCDEDGKDMMHEFTFDKENPFDKPYRDYSSTWSLKSYPLYNHPTLARPHEIDVQSKEKELMEVIADLDNQISLILDHREWTDAQEKHAAIIAEAQAKKGE